MSYPSPCDSCKRKCCAGVNCDRWKIRYLFRQKQINGYARKHAAKMPKAREKFLYEHPDIIRRYLKDGPCIYCKIKDSCDTPCQAYWRWWDARMKWLKGVWGL